MLTKLAILPLHYLKERGITLMNMQRGFRDKLEKYVNTDKEFEVEMLVKGDAVYDYCCFSVDSNNKLSDDRYMVFYNQPQSPKEEIRYFEHNSGVKFSVSLGKIPDSINKLVFTVSIDGSGTMGDIFAHNLSIRQGKAVVLELNLQGNDFHNEKAIISIEIYKKDVWRVSSVASGFNGGLGDLLRAYGGEEIKEDVKVEEKPQQKEEKISLKKGERISFSKNDNIPIIVENGWTAKGKDYDLKALVRYRDGSLIYIGAANEDECLQTPDGAVKHGGDIRNPGELEHISIKWHPGIASVAVSSYSALENGVGSFQKYGVYVKITNGKQIIEIPAANASANGKSYTLCFGEIIFGNTPGALEVINLEMYSKPDSENRIGYKKDKVVMDIGPIGRTKK